MDHHINGVETTLQPEVIKNSRLSLSAITDNINNLIKKTETVYNDTGEITGKQLLIEAPEKMDWLIENLLPRVGLGALAGGSDLGKSSMLRQLAIDISTGGSDWLGVFKLLQTHNSAIVVCTEDDRTSVSFLLRNQAAGHTTDALENLRFLFDYEKLIAELDTRLTNKPADLIVIDCFADAFGGDLKDTQKIRLFLSDYQKLSVKHNCFVLFLHHTGKRTENLEPSKNNLLSGQGFEAKMRLVMELRADPMNANYRHLCIVKGNYLPRAMKTESYVLQFSEQSFTFNSTGERTPFEFLVKQQEDGSKAKYEQARELKDKGYSYERIAETLGYGSKGTITKLFDKATKNGWDK